MGGVGWGKFSREWRGRNWKYFFRYKEDSYLREQVSEREQENEEQV